MSDTQATLKSLEADAKNAVQSLRAQLTSLSTGSCSCGVKSPQMQWHEVTCHARIAYEAMDNLDAIEGMLAKSWCSR